MNSSLFFSIACDARKAVDLLSFWRCKVLLRCSRRQNFVADHVSKCIQTPLCTQRAIHSSCFLFKESSSACKPSSDTIQLIGLNGELRGVMKMRKAEMLAREEQLKLLRAEEKDVTHPVFRLVTAKDLNLELKRLKDIKQSEKKKPVKTVMLLSAISSHDLEIKVKKMLEWLDKGHEIKVHIKTGNSPGGENRIFDQVSTACKDQATIQSSKKTAEELVFQLLPKSGADFEKTSADQNQKPLKLDELKKMRSAEAISLGDELEGTDHKK